METYRPDTDQFVITEADVEVADETVVVGRAATVVPHRADVPALREISIPSLTLKGTWTGQGGPDAMTTVGPFPEVVAGDVVWVAMGWNMPSTRSTRRWSAGTAS